ncbi:capsule biosynthesis protein (plasmid) [Sinorhizobium chiapasense]|uniref:capsule biosynthesis protein n=1 Tax=Sinorhizobium chiapasense TaxID=501572 RepID=UPI002FE13AF8
MKSDLAGSRYRSPSEQPGTVVDTEGGDGRESLLHRLIRTSPVARFRRSDGSIIDAVPTEVSSAGTKLTVATGGKTPIALISFVAFVLVPFIASTIYFALIASDQYISEARFAVRAFGEAGSDEAADSKLLSMSTLPQDGYVVTSFIHSTEILNRIASRTDYREIFSRQGTDFYSRFNKDGSSEEFLQYWKNQVITFVDGPSGIITLKVRTFSPEDSQKLASVIINESEKLVNELSARAQHDLTARFEAEVNRTAESYRRSLAALNDFQNTAGMLAPEARATETGTLLTGLLARKLELDSRIFVLKESNAQSSPAHQQLVLASKNLETQIEELRNDLAGNSKTDENMASAIQTFSRLETDRRVAESMYEVARKNLETAEAEAMRKAVYLVVFVPPTIPEDSLYPHRFSTPLLLALALTASWLTLALIWASIEDHRL